MSTPHQFEVVRQNWQRFPGGWRRLHGETVLASFPTVAEAEADAQRREQAAREAVNPFACGVLWSDRTDMPEPVFFDWAGDADLPPVPETNGRRDWIAWWEQLRQERSAAHAAMVWGMLPRLRFYHVRKREPGLRLFVLSQVAVWEEYDHEDLPDGGWRESWNGRLRLLSEGCDPPILVSLDRARLEQAQATRYAEDLPHFEPNRRYDVRRYTEDPFTGQTGPLEYQQPELVFCYRIDEVPLDALPAPGEPVYLVCRAGYELSDIGLWTLIETDASIAGVPVRAFCNLTDARAYWETLNGEVHTVMDPVLARPGWSTGATQDTPLQELVARWGLPELPTYPAHYDKNKRVVLLWQLAEWYSANGAELSAERRVEMWNQLGDYRYMTQVLAFTPDQPGGRVVS
jgi:hypothetical protein